MPHTVEQAAVTTVVIAVGIVFLTIAQRRWPKEQETDALVLLWRRWGALGRPDKPRKEKEAEAGHATEAAVEAPVAKPEAKAKPDRPAKKAPAKKVPEPDPEPEQPGTWHRVGRRLRRSKAGSEKIEENGPVVEPVAEPPVASKRRRERIKEPAVEESKPEQVAEPEPIEEVEPVDEPEPTPDPEHAVEAKPQPHPSPARAKRLRTSLRRTMSDATDHVPLATAAEHGERSTEPKVLLRQRFRRGLKRTRERLGSEMREAFTGGATPEAFDRLEEALVAADVGVATATTLTNDLRDQIGLSDTTLPKALREVMASQLQDADRRLHLVRGRVSVWVIVGVNGTGKTTTIAKLAARARDLGIDVMLAAADTFRAAAVEQLSTWAEKLGVEVVKQDQGADPGAVVFDALARAKATGKRLLIVDTAGRLHTRKPLMDELQKIFRVIEREEGAVIAETLLVIDATTGQNGIVQAKAFKEAVPVSGLVLAKLDGTAKGGIVFSVERELGVPVKAVGVGEREKDLVPFDPETFVEALVGSDEP